MSKSSELLNRLKSSFEPCGYFDYCHDNHSITRKTNCPNCHAYRYCSCPVDDDTIMHMCKKCGKLNL